MLKRIRFNFNILIQKIFFAIPKYTSNVAFNNWCYRCSDVLYERAMKIYNVEDLSEKCAHFDYKIRMLDIRMQKIEKYIDAYTDDFK